MSNPLSFRLYFSKFWQNNWYNVLNYSFFLTVDLQLHAYFFAFFHGNRKNRRFFSKKFLFDSISMFRLPNRIFLTLNVFDFRIKMSASVKLRRKGLSSLVNFKGFSLAKINSRANVFKLKQSKLVYKFLSRELRSYRKLPWLIKNYRINLYSKIFKGKKTKNLLTFSQQLYRKKFFLAYYLYINSLSSKLISKNLLHTSLQHFFFQILGNYEFFLKKIKDSSLLSDINQSNKIISIASMRTNILFINKAAICSKLTARAHGSSFLRLRLKKQKIKKYFFLSFNNLSKTKNLIIKYKNLLFLINKRIEFFKLKGIKLKYLSNLFWRRARLLSLMYFLRKRSKASYFKHKSLILIFNNRLKKLEKILKNTTIQKVYQSLEEYKIFLSLNLSYLNVFVKVFNKIHILNPKFLLQHYLTLLDKFKLLRFNYRFALYKQGLHKIQDVISTKLLRYKKSGRFLNAYKQNRHGCLEEKQQFILATQLNSVLYPYKFFNFKVKNFLNIFYKKIARFELRPPSRLLMQETQSNLRKTSNLVRNQIDILKSLEKRSYLLKRRVANNYHYFLKFLKLKRVYKFDDTNLKKSIKSTLNNLINRLSRRGYPKARIRKYLGKRYVFLLFKKFINQKYGRQSILKLRLFFFKQKASYIKQRYKYRHLKKNNKLFVKFSKHFFQQSAAKLFNSVNWMSYRRQRLPRLHRVLNSKIYFFNKKNKLKKFKARKFRRKNKYVRKNFKTSFISNFFILSRRIKSRGLRNFNNSNFLFHRQFSKIIKYKNYLHNFILTKKHLFYRNKFRQFFNIKEKHLQFIRVHGKKSINKYSIHFINLKKFRNPFGFKWFGIQKYRLGFNKFQRPLLAFKKTIFRQYKKKKKIYVLLGKLKKKKKVFYSLKYRKAAKGPLKYFLPKKQKYMVKFLNGFLMRSTLKKSPSEIKVCKRKSIFFKIKSKCVYRYISPLRVSTYHLTLDGLLFRNKKIRSIKSQSFRTRIFADLIFKNLSKPYRFSFLKKKKKIKEKDVAFYFIKKKKNRITLLSKNRRFLFFKKYIKLYSRRLRLRYRRLFWGIAVKPLGHFFLNRSSQKKWIRRQGRFYNKRMFKHRSYYSLKFKARRLSKFYKKNFSRRIFKIKLSAFNKKFIRNMRRFKFINFDNMKKGLYSSIRKKMRLSLSRNIRLRWISFHGLFNLTKRFYRKAILRQYYIIKSNSHYLIRWKSYRKKIKQNRWYIFSGFRNPYNVFRSISPIQFRHKIQRRNSALKFYKGFYNFSRFKFLMSIISNKYAYLNVLKYGRQLFFQKTTGFSFSINNILKRNYVMYGLKNNKSILTSVTRLVNPLYSQYMFGGNKTTRILWNDFYVNNTMNRLKLRQKRNLFKHFLFKMRSKTFFQPEVIHNLSSDKKSKNILINDLNSVKKIYITRKISQKFHGFNFIKNKSKIQQSLLFPKLKKNFRKSAFRRFFLRKKSTIHKQFSRKYPVRSFTWKLFRGSRRNKFFYGIGQNVNKSLYRWINRRFRFSVREYNLLELVTLQKNVNKMRIYSFSSFVNKSFVSVPLYFFKLRPLLQMYGVNALTRGQLRRLNKKLILLKRMWNISLKIKTKFSYKLQRNARTLSKLIKLIKYRQSIIKKSSKNLKNLHKFSSLSKKKIIKAFQFYKLNWNYKRQFYLSLRASSDAEALSFAFTGKDFVNFKYRLKFRRQNLSTQVLRAGLLSLRSLKNLKRFRKKKFFGMRYKNFVKKPVFNFVRYALFSDLNSLSKISNLKYYINEFHNANKLNLNLKRLTHANLYSWGKFSYALYTKAFSSFFVMPNNMNFLNNLFLKKKINNLNIKSLNFYKLTKVLFLRNKYNYYFLIRHKLKKFVMFYNKLYFNYSSKLLYSNNLKKLFYFNLFTKKLRFGSIFFLRRKITTFSNFKFFKSLQKLNKIKRIRLNIVLKKNIQSKRKSLFRNFVKFFNKKKLFCNRLIIKHKLFFNPKLRRSLKVRFLRTKSSQYSQVLKKNLLGNINKRPSSGTKIFFLLNLDKFLALKSSNSFFRLKNNISVFNLNRYFSLYNLKQLNGKKKINLKKNKSIYDKLKSKSTWKNTAFMFNVNKLFLSQNQVDFFFKSTGVSNIYNNNTRYQNKNTRKNHYNNNDYKLKNYSNRNIYNNQKNYNNQNSNINKFNRQNIYNNQKNYNSQNKNKYAFKNNQQINAAPQIIKINSSINRSINKRAIIMNQKKKVFFFKDRKIKHLTFKYFYLNKLAYLSNLSLCINNKINRRRFFLLKKNAKLLLLAKPSIAVVPRKFYYKITARPLFVYKKKPLFLNGSSQIYKNISKNLYPDKLRPKFLFNVKNKKKYSSFFNKNRIFVSFWHNQLKNNSKDNLKLFFPKRDSLRNFRIFFKNTRALSHRRTKFIKSLVPNIWSFYTNNKNVEPFSTLRKVDVRRAPNKDFFAKILKILKYKYSFIQRFMFKFNTRLFLYLVRYLLLQKYCKNYSYSLEAMSVGQQVMQYSLLNKFVKNIAVPFSSIINLNSFILHRKIELIRYSKFNNCQNSFNSSQIKVNLFILLFNILLMYRRALKKNKGYARILLIAFKFQKYLWIRIKRKRHFSYLLQFKSLLKLKRNSVQQYGKQISKQSNWRNRFWVKLSNFLISEKRIFLKTKTFKHGILWFRLKLKIKLLGSSYYYLSFFFKWHLTRRLFKNFNSSLFLRFNILLEPTAFFLAKEICHKLRRGLPLNRIVNSIIYRVPQVYANILSIQVKCVGRHTRKERASKNWYKNGSLRISNIKSNLDYASVGIVLRYGFTNIKVWILKKKFSGSLPGLATAFV